MWTRFMDMCSGGSRKEPYDKILIEAPEDEAKVIFYNRFGHNPERVTCTCCGDDYSISEHESLAQLTGYDRNCRVLETPRYMSGPKKGLYKNDDPIIENHAYLEDGEDVPEGYQLSAWKRYRPYQTLEEYLKRDDVLAIYAKDIKDAERVGEVPQEGYVWI